MKKILFAAALIGGLLLTACGGPKVDQTDPMAIMNESINEVDANIPLVESPELGTIPSLYARLEASMDTARALTRNPKLEAKVLKGDERAEEKLDKILEAREIAREELAHYYGSQMQTELNQLAGKELPLQFSTAQFSSGKAVLTNTLNKYVVNVDYEMVLARSVSVFEDRGLRLEYLDKDGNVIETVTTSHKIWPDTYDAAGRNIIRAVKGAIWKSTISLYIPDAAEMTSIRISFKNR